MRIEGTQQETLPHHGNLTFYAKLPTKGYLDKIFIKPKLR